MQRKAANFSRLKMMLETFVEHLVFLQLSSLNAVQKLAKQ